MKSFFETKTLRMCLYVMEWHGMEWSGMEWNVCMYVCIYVCLLACLLGWLFVCLFVSLFLCLFFCLRGLNLMEFLIFLKYRFVFS